MKGRKSAFSCLRAKVAGLKEGNKETVGVGGLTHLGDGTYLGGSGDDEVDTHELAVDSVGNAFVAVWTTSTDYPTTAGAFQPKAGGGNDEGISKIGPDGTLLASTYLGGRSGENIEGMSVDKAGNLYVTGTTHSPDFPTAGSPYQATYGSSSGAYDGNAFLAVFTPDFKTLLYSTFLGQKSSITGQNAYGGIHGSWLAADGSWIVGGSWCSAGWPVKNALQAYVGGVSPDYADATLARFVPVSTNPAPRLRISTPIDTASGSSSASPTLQWPASEGIAYEVEWSANLTRWFLADTVTPPASGAADWRDDGTKTAGNADHRFYRLEVRLLVP